MTQKGIKLLFLFIYLLLSKQMKHPCRQDLIKFLLGQALKSRNEIPEIVFQSIL